MYIDKITNIFFQTIGTNFLPLSMAFLIIVAILIALLKPVDF